MRCGFWGLHGALELISSICWWVYGFHHLKGLSISNIEIDKKSIWNLVLAGKKVRGGWRRQKVSKFEYHFSTLILSMARGVKMTHTVYIQYVYSIDQFDRWWTVYSHSINGEQNLIDMVNRIHRFYQWWTEFIDSINGEQNLSAGPRGGRVFYFLFHSFFLLLLPFERIIASTTRPTKVNQTQISHTILLLLIGTAES